MEGTIQNLNPVHTSLHGATWCIQETLFSIASQTANRTLKRTTRGCLTCGLALGVACTTCRQQFSLHALPADNSFLCMPVALIGGPHVACRIQEMPMFPVTIKSMPHVTPNMSRRHTVVLNLSRENNLQLHANDSCNNAFMVCIWSVGNYQFYFRTFLGIDLYLLFQCYRIIWFG